MCNMSNTIIIYLYKSTLHKAFLSVTKVLLICYSFGKMSNVYYTRVVYLSIFDMSEAYSITF